MAVLMLAIAIMAAAAVALGLHAMLWVLLAGARLAARAVTVGRSELRA